MPVLLEEGNSAENILIATRSGIEHSNLKP